MPFLYQFLPENCFFFSQELGIFDQINCGGSIYFFEF